MNLHRTRTPNDPPLLVAVATPEVADAVMTAEDLWRAWAASKDLPVSELPIDGPVSITNSGNPAA
jgi:hypothetical protein